MLFKKALLVSSLSIAHVFAAASHADSSLSSKNFSKKASKLNNESYQETGFGEIFGQEYLSPSFIAPVIQDDLETLLHMFKPKLPSREDAIDRIDGVRARHSWGDQLEQIMQQLQYPKAFTGISGCSSLLLTGPSGSGKTLFTKDFAAAIKRKTLLIKGSAVKNQYQNSGASFLRHLFHVLSHNSNHKFLVIIDELRPIIEFDEDKTQIQQRDTATAFWQSLDECEEQQHICLICTDNMKPDKMDKRIKTRFGGNIFEFLPIDTATVAKIMKKQLTPKDDSAIASSSSDGSSDEVTPLMVNNCSDAFIFSKAKAASYLSVRDIKTFVEQAKRLAASERLKKILSEGNPEEKMLQEQQPITVEERHLDHVWNSHNIGTLSRLGSNPIFKACVSEKAIFCLTGLTAFGVTLYGITKQKQEFEKAGMLALGAIRILHSLFGKDKDVSGILSALSETSQHIGHLEQLAQSRSIEEDRFKTQVNQFERTHHLALVANHYSALQDDLAALERVLSGVEVSPMSLEESAAAIFQISAFERKSAKILSDRENERIRTARICDHPYRDDSLLTYDEEQKLSIFYEKYKRPLPLHFHREIMKKK